MGYRMCTFETSWSTNDGLQDFLSFLRSVGIEVRTDASSDLVSIVYPTELPLDAESVRARALDMVHRYETHILNLEGRVRRLNEGHRTALGKLLEDTRHSERVLEACIAEFEGDL